MIKKNDELDRLTDECRNLQIKINENNIKSKNKALNNLAYINSKNIYMSILSYLMNSKSEKIIIIFLKILK